MIILQMLTSPTNLGDVVKDLFFWECSKYITRLGPKAGEYLTRPGPKAEYFDIPPKPITLTIFFNTLCILVSLLDDYVHTCVGFG